MQPIHSRIHVLMPDDSKTEVTYYCSDEKLSLKDRLKFTQLYIQLHDCICLEKIERAVSTKLHELETIVHNRVIGARGHLC